LLAFTIFFYGVVYTLWLKRRTPQNIVIGGLAGALPPAIGWAAASGTAPANAWLLVAIIFFWTPPHFWALALTTSDDYARAGVPMLPVVKGEAFTRRRILAYSLVVVPLGVLPAFTGLGGVAYLVVSCAAGAAFLFLAARLASLRSGEAAMTDARQAPVRLLDLLSLPAFRRPAGRASVGPAAAQARTVSDPNNEPPVAARARRGRNVALAIALFAFVAIVFVVTIVNWGAMPAFRTDPARHNARLAMICAAVFFAMVGAAFASVPLYRAFCGATGFNGAVRTGLKLPRAATNDTVTVRFDTNVRGLAWRFEPVQARQTARLGESKLAFFRATTPVPRP